MYFSLSRMLHAPPRTLLSTYRRHMPVAAETLIVCVCVCSLLVTSSEHVNWHSVGAADRRTDMLNAN